MIKFYYGDIVASKYNLSCMYYVKYSCNTYCNLISLHIDKTPIKIFNNDKDDDEYILITNIFSPI